MRNIKMTVAYDGSDFSGWQIQPGKPTIQGALADIARKLTQEKVFIQGAGRTDAGVHALGQTINFKTNSALLPLEFQRAFNALLPASIRVLGAEEVERDFHARWSALAKTYRYRIARERIISPFEWRYVLHYPYPLDEDAMLQAARLFEGQHDFASFAASTGSGEEDADRTTLREVYSAELVRQGGELIFTVRGKSFLRYMVRKMAGTLLEVGRGKLSPPFIRELYELKDRSRSGPTVPPQGLCLVSVEYPAAWWKVPAASAAAGEPPVKLR